MSHVVSDGLLIWIMIINYLFDIVFFFLLMLYNNFMKSLNPIIWNLSIYFNTNYVEQYLKTLVLNNTNPVFIQIALSNEIHFWYKICLAVLSYLKQLNYQEYLLLFSKIGSTKKFNLMLFNFQCKVRINQLFFIKVLDF